MSERPGRDGATGTDDYSAVYYHDYSGPPYTYQEPHWSTFFGRIADQVIALFEPGTAYDAGCAKGFMVRALAERGVDARGGDISEFAISEAPAGLAERLEVKDLTAPFDRRYDVIICIEVLEHMSAQDARAAVANMAAATDVVVLSTTPDDYTEPTHVNIRQASSWAQDFATHGLYRRTDVDASFLSPWAVVYDRRGLRPLELISGYETLLQPLLREVHEKRQALLDLRRQLDEAAAPVMIERDALIAERDGLRAELEHAAVDRDALVAELDARTAERAVLARERDEAVDQRNRAAAERQELSSAALLARLAVMDELIGARAEVAELRVHSESAIADAGKDAGRLREMLSASTAEVARATTSAQLAHAEAANQVRAAIGERDHGITAVKSSASWRIGQAALLPVTVVRRWRRR